MEDLNLNPKFIAILAVIGILIVICAPNLVFGLIKAPFSAMISENENVTAIKKMVQENPNIMQGIKAHPEVVKALEENTTDKMIKNVPITIFVTPTPDGKNYFAGEYQNGTRKISRPFSFYRENVTGTQDLKITARVYDYKIFNNIHYFNPSDYKYYLQYPSSTDKKFLFVFFNIYSDEVVGNAVTIWLSNHNQIQLLAKNTVYNSVDYPLHLRIKELEDVSTYDDSVFSESYGQHRVYSKSRDYVESAGEYSQLHYYVGGGKSNAEDGYILFEIPKDIKAEDILVNWNFWSFGNAAWRLQVPNEIE